MLFYDFEVFKYNWLVVIIDMINKQYHTIIDDKATLEKLYEANKSNIWVGFNSRHYDQYILKGILCDFDPSEVNDYIIKDHKPGWRFSPLFKKLPLNNFDVMQKTDRGLKVFEGFMGNDIRETSVPFDIDRPLTKEESAETVKYCTHDVEQTIEVFLRRREEFDVIMYFLKHYNLPLSYIGKTKPQLAAIILGGNGKGAQYDDEFDFPILDCIQLNKYKYVADWYKEHKSYDQALDTIIANVPHRFSWGGGHGALCKTHKTGIFLMIDVTAYYPEQQYQFKFGYRVMDNQANFEFIHGENKRFKRLGDKKARQPFKIMDNAISGQMKQPTSKLYDPMSNNSICINGQLLLLDLVEHLEPYCELMQNNTDGLLVRINQMDDFDIIDDIVYEWEQRTGLSMDIDMFVGDLYQKDVNNYLIVDRENGNVKRKGSYVKKLGELDYDLPIINKALNKFMINHVPVEETINNCNELIEFQKIVKVSSSYLYGIKDAVFAPTKVPNGLSKKTGRQLYKTVTMWTGEGIKLTDKTFRVFASTDPNDGGIYKVKELDKNPEKFSDTSEHCYIYNESVLGVKVHDKLDKQWYIDLAKSRLEDFGLL